MERSITLLVFALPAFLAACGGGSNHAPSGSSASSPPLQVFSVGGSLSGLTATGLTLTNGTDSLSLDSTATSFAFPTQVASGSNYSVAISMQPSGQRCSLINASGTVTNAAVTNVIVTCAARLWTWSGGSQFAGQTNVTGTKGTPDVNNAPGARTGAVSWTDSAGNLWIFGGEVFQTGYPNDLWKYSPIDGAWTWVSGADMSNAFAVYPGVYGNLRTPSPTSTPGGRHWAVAWSDAQNNLWLFGGLGYDANGNWGLLNDLWKFTPSTGQWTWVSGSDTKEAISVYGVQGVAASTNTPGSRDQVAAWTDAQSNLWLYGGFGDDSTGQAQGALGDLWKFDTSALVWAWIGGVTSVNEVAAYPAVGTGSASATPGGREGSVTWVDKAGDFWLFGGTGFVSATTGGTLDDLWRYSPATGAWSWLSGSQTPNAVPSYGTLGSTDAAHGPGARTGSLSWADASGNLWLFGGYWISVQNLLFVPQYVSDLWEYRPSTGKWTWASGSSTSNIGGVYGTLGTGTPANMPGSRYLAVGGVDKQGNFWVLGGGGYDGASTQGYLNDLWKY